MINRRQILGTMLGGGAALGLPLGLPLGDRAALAADKRVIKAMSNANVAAIHVPGNVAIREIVQTIGDYGPTDLSRLEKLTGITQMLVGGAPDIVDGDTASLCAAVAAGADLKIVGQFYASSDLVFVANADKVQTLQDVLKPDVVIGINSPGDIVDALLLGVLLQHKIDISKVNILSLGGSSARNRALLAGRVQVVPIHIDQFKVMAKQGNYKLLIKPWEEYKFWSNEVWAVNGKWLEKPDNQKLVIDVLEAQLRANKSATNDFNWYAEKFRKYSNDKDAAHWTDDQIREQWSLLAHEVKAWPEPMPLDLAAFNALIPIYERAGIVGKGASFDKLIEPRYLAEAQKRMTA